MSIQQRMICEGCGAEISEFTAMMNSRLGPMDRSRLDMCNKCRDRLTQALSVEPGAIRPRDI